MASSSQPTAHAPPSSPSKRQKLSLQEEADGVDRISDLPDCLLCHILSFLPTRNAVGTSILSSRWKTLWTFVPCLYLDGILNLHIMSQVFAQHKALYIRKFFLGDYRYCDSFHVDTWGRTYISPYLEELDLTIYAGMFELPRSIFCCKNLVILKLSGKILLNLPASFQLPSLKILHLCLKDYNDWRLLSGCLVLEDLVLKRYGHYSDEAVKLEICVPTLKRLKFVFRIYGPFLPDYELEINAPSLEYFDFQGDLGEVVFLEKLPNLVEANIDIAAFGCGDTLYYADEVLGLLRELYNVKFLSLSHDTIMCLSFVNDHYGLPKFHNLARLNYEFCCFNWRLQRYLLEQAPNLEVLVVDKLSCATYAHRPVCLKQLLNGSRDLSPCLTTFYFSGFKGLKDELKFVRCVLKNARILKKMTFRYGGNYQNAVEEKSRILKKVSTFPRCSMTCQLSFE